METSLGEKKFWIQTSCRPGEGWALSNYSCPRHTTWIISPTTKPGYKKKFLSQWSVTYVNL